jgi:hypothetical protein
MPGETEVNDFSGIAESIRWFGLSVFPPLRPCGLPSASNRLNGAGHTGHPALDGLKWATCPFHP